MSSGFPLCQGTEGDMLSEIRDSRRHQTRTSTEWEVIPARALPNNCITSPGPLTKFRPPDDSSCCLPRCKGIPSSPGGPLSSHLSQKHKRQEVSTGINRCRGKPQNGSLLSGPCGFCHRKLSSLKTHNTQHNAVFPGTLRWAPSAKSTNSRIVLVEINYGRCGPSDNAAVWRSVNGAPLKSEQMNRSQPCGKVRLLIQTEKTFFFFFCRAAQPEKLYFCSVDDGERETCWMPE